MEQDILGRMWNRLVDRYSRDVESDCCGPEIEEVQSDSPESGAESSQCCK